MAGDFPVPNSHTAGRQKLTQNLRFLAAALRAEAELVASGSGTANVELLEIVGWTIYEADQGGLLDPILKLDELLDAEHRHALFEGNPKRLRDADLPAGPLIVRDANKTIADFLRELEAESAKLTPDNPDASTKVAPHSSISPADAAVGLVHSVWQFLERNHRDRLPDDIARSVLNNPFMSSLWMPNGVTFRKTAFVCDFLAVEIARQLGKTGQALPPLSDNAATAYEILLELPLYRALTAPRMIEKLREKGVHISQSDFTSRIVPELKAYGIDNAPRKGYFIPTSRRPKSE
jgi:hypothetical protein